VFSPQIEQIFDLFYLYFRVQINNQFICWKTYGRGICRTWYGWWYDLAPGSMALPCCTKQNGESAQPMPMQQGTPSGINKLPIENHLW
jgi:hypothetical protein